MFRDLGVDGVIQGGQTMNPSTEDILAKVRQVPAETVFVLPNNKNIILAAQQAAALCESKRVVVIESRTVPQGITALMSFDPDGDEETNTAAMTEALDAVATMQITYAARDSDFEGHDIHEGDYMSMREGKLVDVSTDITALLAQLGDAIAAEGRELVTLFYGEDISPEEAETAQAALAARCPDAEVELVCGGQPVYYYMISAE